MEIPFDEISREQWLQQVAKELKTEMPEEGLSYQLEDLTISAGPTRDNPRSEALRTLFDNLSSNWDILVPASGQFSEEELLNLGATAVLDSERIHIFDNEQHNIDIRQFNGISLTTSESIAIGLLNASKALQSKEFKRINVVIPLSSQFYMNIAALRAFRWLFTQLQRHFDHNCELYLHAQAKHDESASAEDALIGYTCQAVSAIAGKADGVQLPLFKNEDSISGYRLSINIFNLLRVESLLDQHAEAASGSWFIDGLTTALIEKSWNWLLAMNANGKGERILSGEYTLIKELDVD